MALALTDEHLALAEAVRGWAGRTAPPAVVRAAVASDDNGAALYRDRIAPALAAQGLLGLHLAESSGGQGFGLPELAVTLEELGQALLPGVFLPSVLASAVLASTAPGASGPGEGTAPPVGEADVTAAVRTPGATGPWDAESTGHRDSLASLTRALAEGTLSGAVGLAPGIRGTPVPGLPGTTTPHLPTGTTAASGTADPGAGALVIDGTCGPVLGAGAADLVILPASVDDGTGDGQRWVVADAGWLRITPVDSLDLTRPAGSVSAEAVTVPAGRVLRSQRPGAVMSLAATLLAAEACGIANWAVATASAHAKIRHQFGRPIGQFQAVKHRCAWILTAAEQAAAAVWDAARAQQDHDAADGGAEFAAGVAAVIAVDAAVTCTHECIQVLGGIGYTWEHDAHLYYRRALSLRSLLGRSGEWAGRVAALALAGARRPATVDLPPQAEPVRARIRGELAQVTGTPPAERAALLAAGGWVMPHLPQPWGRGSGPVEQAAIALELREAKLRPPVLAIGAWVVPALVQYGTPAQQERLLPATLRGEIAWCQLFSEPGAGSDLASLATRAERAAGGWRLTGQKIWTSLAREAAWAICVARTDPQAPRHEGITYFLVDMSSPGIQVRPLREMTGDALFSEVFLDDVFVPDDLVVGGEGNGWRVARATLANERVSLSQSWAFGCGVTDLLEVVSGLGDAPGPGVLERAGRLVCEGQAVDLLGTRVALKQLSGTEPGATGSVRKLLGMRLAQQIAEECWVLTGPDGAVNSSRWARAVLFSRALTIGGGTTDIQLNIIGERILGLPRDPLPGE